MIGQLVLAEIRRLEQVLDQDHVRALSAAARTSLFGLRDIRGRIPGTGELRGGEV